ncbi:MAG: energy transducer TonB [Myxococcales bacterium]|nr:energy transducer TonB [Myxococcales bacterium]
MERIAYFLEVLRGRRSLRWSFATLASIFLHAGLAFALILYKPSPQPPMPKKVMFRLIKPRPAPRPRVEPRPAPRPRPRPRPRIRPKPRPRPRKRKIKRAKPRPRPRAVRRIPPPNQPPRRPPPRAEEVQPIFGVSMDSLSRKPGGRNAVRVGNTLMKDPEGRFTPPSKVRPYTAPPGEAGDPQGTGKKDVFQPVPDFELDKYPQEIQCPKAPYPVEAERMGIQAAVVSSLEIRKNGRVRRVRVISIRPQSASKYGFAKAVRRSLRRCRFKAARFKGKAVDAVIRYTSRFVPSD